MDQRGSKMIVNLDNLKFNLIMFKFSKMFKDVQKISKDINIIKQGCLKKFKIIQKKLKS
jgi:hypothetical protein